VAAAEAFLLNRNTVVLAAADYTKKIRHNKPAREVLVSAVQKRTAAVVKDLRSNYNRPGCSYCRTNNSVAGRSGLQDSLVVVEVGGH